MFYQLFLFSRKLLIFFSPFFCRFAGHLSFYFRNIHPLPMYVTNIFGQVVLSHSLFCILGVQGLYKFFSVLSNHVYKSFPLNSETLRSLPTHNTWRNSPIFFLVFVFIFTFSFLVHLEFILRTMTRRSLYHFPYGYLGMPTPLIKKSFSPVDFHFIPNFQCPGGYFRIFYSVP